MLLHTGILSTVVDQTTTISAALRANANQTTVPTIAQGTLTLGQATDIFTNYLATTSGFQVGFPDCPLYIGL